MIAQFHQLPIGARFEFRGRRYEKLALSLAGDEDRCGNVFHAATEVLWDTALGARFGTAAAALSAADGAVWTRHLAPAPAARESRP